MPNIYLTGFMGAGKSTIGPKLARQLDYEFDDSDSIIEQEAEKSVSEIFQQNGEPYFRLLEKKVLLQCAARTNTVIALGGGTLIDLENRITIKKTGILIYLSTGPQTIWDRVKSTDKRPLLRNSDGSLVGEDDAIRHLEQLLKVRRDGYHSADLTVTTDDKSIDEVQALILKYISDKVHGEE